MKISEWELYRLLVMVDRAVSKHGARITRVKNGTSDKSCIAPGRDRDLKIIRDWLRERKAAKDEHAA
jgi:hypothetical protein